jgi:glycosyltransferase involved in cell wall biosynthesis
MEIDKTIRRVCLIPEVRGVGGMVSFRDRLEKALMRRGIAVSHSLGDRPYEAVLVIGGTRNLAGIWQAKKRGVRVIQRLDGMNWIHRKVRTGLRHYLRAEYGNFILSTIRSHLADGIIYQSEFSHQWWESAHGKSSTPGMVVHNGVDLDLYSPVGPEELPRGTVRVLLVEGTIGGGYEFGLRTAAELAEHLQDKTKQQVELLVAGRISKSLQESLKTRKGVSVEFLGQVPGASIPALDRSAHVLYAADLQPACPNSVIEALACGLPVAGFDTGALGEIVTPNCGKLVPYGGDPWKLDPPDIAGLVEAVEALLASMVEYRWAARQRAEEAFGVEPMVDGYLEMLAG